MQQERIESATAVENAAILQSQLEQRLARDELTMPRLSDVTVRVVRIGTQDSSNAERLSCIIGEDPTLAGVVLRIAASAASRPAMPITSLRHAVAWLGHNEVANIAFTLALQGQLLHVPGQLHKARRLWRHALASALWSRQLAQVLGVETGPSYLCGLLHDIGRIVTLGAVHEIARVHRRRLDAERYDRLIALFHRQIGGRVVESWQLPPSVLSVNTHWEHYEEAGGARFASTLVNVAHRLADYTIREQTAQARDELVTDPAYRELGPRLEDGASLFDSAADISAEMNRYLCP